MFTSKPKFSSNDLEHWLLARAAEEAAAIAKEGLDPNNFYYLWSIVGVPTARWDKKDGPPPPLVPVIAIDLAKLIPLL